ncbi:MAG: 1-deoxy-D-xylulose-5-phosphate synthase [Pseudomonadota bacterium]
MATTQIMYIEQKDGITGPGRVGRIALSKTGKTLVYGDRKFQSLKGEGYKANYFDLESGDHFWISGCRKDGNDSLYPGTIDIDEDVREEYWRETRQLPERINDRTYRSFGKHSMGGRRTK